MATRYDDSDGSDIFWPGYVDATTNLILNLLFLLTILIVAVFMFALELGRSSQTESEISVVPISTEKIFVSQDQILPNPAEETLALKNEIARLRKMLAQHNSQKVQSGDKAKTVDATTHLPKPSQGLDKALASEFEVLVRFIDDAIVLSDGERKRLLESLKPVLDKDQTHIYVEVPAGFSEAKRMGFYRAMAVRNLLIEMKLPKGKINVSVIEGKNTSDASLVRVRSH